MTTQVAFSFFVLSAFAFSALTLAACSTSRDSDNVRDDDDDLDGPSVSGGARGGDGSGGQFTTSGSGGEPGVNPTEGAFLGGKRAAVSLTYDDGLDSQLKFALPALDARGLKATFFLASFQGVDHAWSLPNLTDPLSDRHNAWLAAAQGGHELGAHTIYHPCDNNNPGYRPGDYDAASMGAELDESNQRLSRLGAAPQSFAYPCALDLSGIDDGVSMMPLVNERYAAARTSAVGVNFPGAYDPSATAQKFGDSEGMSAEELIAYVDEAIAAGGWAVITFHGVGADQTNCDINVFNLEACALSYLSTAEADHVALLDYLKAKESEVWTAPFGTVAAHLLAVDEFWSTKALRGVPGDYSRLQ